MRIAAFISHPIQYFTPLWQELSKRPGVELTVYYFSRQGLDPSLDREFGVRFAWDIDVLAGHEHVFLPRQWPTLDPLDHRPRSLNKGIVSILRQNWDVVFIAGYAHLNNWLIVAACERLGIPVICWGDNPLGWSPPNSLPKRIIKRGLLNWFVKRITAFLAVGGQTRAYFHHCGAPLDSIFICPLAVDVARFRGAVQQAGPTGAKQLRQRWQIPEGTRIVMFCGKLAPWKRPLDLVRALGQLNRTDVIAAFVGDGALRDEVLTTGGDRVRVTGFVNQREIPLALSLADILVLPSSQDHYGIVVSEAHCLGIPAIVSDACGCYGVDSVLQDGRSGFVYPMGSVDALAARLSELLNDESLRTAMGEQAKLQGETQSQSAAADGFLAGARYATQQARRAQDHMRRSYTRDA